MHFPRAAGGLLGTTLLDGELVQDSASASMSFLAFDALAVDGDQVEGTLLVLDLFALFSFLFFFCFLLI